MVTCYNTKRFMYFSYPYVISWSIYLEKPGNWRKLD